MVACLSILSRPVVACGKPLAPSTHLFGEQGFSGKLVITYELLRFNVCLMSLFCLARGLTKQPECHLRKVLGLEPEAESAPSCQSLAYRSFLAA